MKNLWQLLDIAYIIPVTVGAGYFIGKYLDSKFEGEYSVAAIMIAALCGFILTIVKIKRFVDQVNKSD